IHVSKKFRDVAVSANFEAGGGCTALFGASGAGKSTIINMIAGLTVPDSGRIEIDGALLFDSQKKINLPPEKRGIGYVFQDSRLFPHLTVLKNITYGLKKGEDRRKAAEISDFLGITPLLHRYPKNLSGGEKQRVALGRALLSSPKILLMDEPLASLDAVRRDELVEYILSLKEFSIPIIYVTHTLEEIMRLADYLAVMDGGKLVKIGETLEVVNSGLFIERLTPKEFGTVCAGKVLQSGSNGATVEFLGHRLELAGVFLKADQSVRFRIPALDAALSLEKPATSARNIFVGKVLAIRLNQEIADILTDIGGVSVWARITRHSIEEMNIKLADRVFITVKSVAVAQHIWSTTSIKGF
ncbi:MAG: molybdenum ABC transporter ATP-binding protein, partial [Deferribacteraceae bacterium]|nr:molybdenum ABC transporter ATP-binding protein [Deferribacteraceae bacterium]